VQAIIVFLFKSQLGKMLMSFLFKKLWQYIDDMEKDKLLEEKLKTHIKEKLTEYEKIIEQANEMAKDGLSEDEKAEIRKRKIDVETSIINHNSNIN
jgi:hypothetical protein